MDFEKARFNMVEQQIRPWDVLDFDVLDALAEIPRELFVDEDLQGLAYADMALPLANGHKMLEPKVVARLAQGLKLTKNDTVLEIGTGSGYATALLAKLAGRVVSDDIDVEQQNRAKAVLDGLGLDNIDYVQNNGLTELSAGAPFDAVYVGGAVNLVPEVLKEQLKEQLKDGGRMVVIVGRKPVQRALLITRRGDVFEEKVLFDTLVAHLDDKDADPFGGFDF
ncbi:TPA: protein-L-isoaspartate O-methyltransferase family protein [Neisseria meningitidis]